jgi:hypothetical protein
MDCDGVAKGSNTPASQETESFFMEMRKVYVDGNTKAHERTMEVTGDTSNFEKLFFNHRYSYDLAITKTGYIAWVPQGTQPNDVLCFFRGLDVPMVLRPTNRVRERFQLMGEGYIQGYMHGEAMALGREKIWFCIV